MLSPLTKMRWQKFRKVKRGYYSLWALGILYALSLVSELWINEVPLIVRYQGAYHFPVFSYVSDEDMGGEYLTPAEFKKLQEEERFAENNPEGNFMVFPLVPYGYNEATRDFEGYPPSPPDSNHILGTDDRGRDLFARLVYGFRVSMTFALVILVLEIILGVFAGAIQGYFGGKVDILGQRLIEIIVAVPFLYLVILFADIFGPSLILLTTLFAAFGWIGMSRYIRGEFLRGRKKEYVDAARALGVSPTAIIFRHILPNSLTPIITLAPFSIASAIASLSMLDFLGFGVPAPTASWGEILSQARSNLTSYHLSIFPVLALLGTLLLINFVGEAIREAFDPKPFFKYKG